MVGQAPPYSDTVTCFITPSMRRGSLVPARREKEIAALEAERRREQSGTWKDVASLKRELRLLLRERDEEKRRQQVIEP